MERAALRGAADGRLRAAAWALVLRVYWAGANGPAVFSKLVEEQPALASSEQAKQIAANLREFGYIEL